MPCCASTRNATRSLLFCDRFRAFWTAKMSESITKSSVRAPVPMLTRADKWAPRWEDEQSHRYPDAMAAKPAHRRQASGIDHGSPDCCAGSRSLTTVGFHPSRAFHIRPLAWHQKHGVIGNVWFCDLDEDRYLEFFAEVLECYSAAARTHGDARGKGRTIVRSTIVSMGDSRGCNAQAKHQGHRTGKDSLHCDLSLHDLRLSVSRLRCCYSDRAGIGAASSPGFVGYE